MPWCCTPTGGAWWVSGLALLSIIGNVVTAWLWFGVNELNVGLHTYGRTEGVLQTLAIVVAAHLLVVALGPIPENRWRSAIRLSRQANS